MKSTILTIACLALLPLALAHDPAGTPKLYCEPTSEWLVHDYGPALAVPGSVSYRPPTYDGNLDDCNGNGNPFDFDGHREWAAGWARLHADDGDGFTSGSIACHGVLSHHARFPTVFVSDLAFGPNVPFLVMADSYNSFGPDPTSGRDCGDGQVTPCGDSRFCLGDDPVATCFEVCSVTFPPGLDGSYIVLVNGVAGHVVSN